MLLLQQLFQSSVGKKLITALTGFFLVTFVVFHLLGNLALYLPDPSIYNLYSHKLVSLGPLLLVAEVGLLLIALLHVYSTISLVLKSRVSKGAKLGKIQTKGGPSRRGFASRFMAVSGSVLLFFLVIHIWQFRFGPGVSEGYVTQISGEEVRDLHRLIKEVFQNPLYVILYVLASLQLGLHLRHGFWSFVQSLGLMQPRFSKPLHCFAWILGGVLALGFLGIPIWIYLGGISR